MQSEENAPPAPLGKKWRPDIWFLLNDNAPAHRSVFGQGFLREEQCNNIAASQILS